MTYIPKHELSGVYKLTNPPGVKRWTPRKTLVVAAAAKITSKDRTHVYATIEGVINEWEQNHTCLGPRKYFKSCNERAIQLLITSVIKEAKGLK